MEVPSFLSLSFNDNEPLQEQLHHHLTDWICAGRLLPGSRLPGSRLMASELGVSRNTVTLVLDQLKAEGFLDSQPGRGVYISADLPNHATPLESERWKMKRMQPRLSRYGNALRQRTSSGHDSALPFTPGIPDLSAFPLAIWQSIQRQHQSRLSLMGYNQDQGYPPLQEALADYLCLSRGVRCHARQIIITQGAQQAISLCAQVLLNEGDSVLIENPGYAGARKAFQARGAALVACPLAEHGVDLVQLQQITVTSNLPATNLPATNQPATNLPARLMYITPTHQYPLGGILPAAQRLALLDWAAENNTWLLEDDYDSEFHYHHKPIASMQGMADESPVLYMGSFSKTLFPALRLGYLVVPEELVDIFVQAKSFMSGETPLLPQAIAADFIREGHFVRHLRRMRKLYEQKWKHLNQLLASHLSEVATPIAQSAGMHLAIEIPDIDDNELKRRFQDAGFGSSSLSSYYLAPHNAPMTGLVLGFANTTPQERERGILELDRLIEKTST